MSVSRIKISSKKKLCETWFKVERVNFDYKLDDGTWQNQTRDIHDHGNGAGILLYNKDRKTIILTQQLRIATYLNGNNDGLIIEVPAGLLDTDDPETCVIREVEEETGYRINSAKKVYELYMTPGSVTELLHLFIGEYNESMKVSEGGGLDEEHENIEVLEVKFSEAIKMMESGKIKDAKTVMLLQYAMINNII